MKLHTLKPAAGSTKSRKRVGRGMGAGTGKTSCKGHKGQNARSGGGVPAWFQGGQSPLIRRIPKRGFTNIFKTEYAVINLKDLDKFDDGSEIDMGFLRDKGLVGKNETRVKLLGNGEINKKFTVKIHKVSKSAAEKIQSAGGSIEVV